MWLKRSNRRSAGIGDADAVAPPMAYTDDVFGALINAIVVVDPALVFASSFGEYGIAGRTPRPPTDRDRFLI